MISEEDKKAGAEANRLRMDPAFQLAMTEARKGALEELASVEASDINTIMRLQAEIKAIDLIATNLATAIIRATEPRKIAV